MLTRIRNSNLGKIRKVTVTRSNLVVNILTILRNEGFIDSFEESGKTFSTQNGSLHHYVEVFLKFKGVNQKPYITKLKRISKPGLRVYVTHSNIPKVLGGVGTAVLSTSYGLMTDRKSRSLNLGGEVLFYIW